MRSAKSTPISAISRSQALRRGLEILCLFTDERRDWGISELAKHLNEHKSIVHRAIKTLEDVGFLRQDALTQRYSLGFTAYQMGVVAARTFGFTTVIRTKLTKLSEQIGATVYIVVRDGDANRVVDTFETSALIRFNSPVGTRIPWNRGASSKLLYAHAPAEDVQRMIEKHGLPRHTDRTIVGKRAFLAELQEIRARGFSLSDSEGIDGVLGIATPIFGVSGFEMAALQTTLTSTGVSENRRKEIVASMVATAKEVSALLRPRGA
jgi:DNA-binding IclR family transcriptional regulator